MPKDATKNVDRYKVRGGQINEFDFHRNQEQFAEQKEKPAATKSPKGTNKKGPNKAAKKAGRKATKK
jgi:hypothetical protein